MPFVTTITTTTLWRLKSLNILDFDLHTRRTGVFWLWLSTILLLIHIVIIPPDVDKIHKRLGWRCICTCTRIPRVKNKPGLICTPLWRCYSLHGDSSSCVTSVHSLFLRSGGNANQGQIFKLCSSHSEWFWESLVPPRILGIQWECAFGDIGSLSNTHTLLNERQNPD